MPRFQPPSTGNATIVCLEASTVTESFAMMVGSTLGAFLALAIVVSMVYLAKRQRKHFKKYPDYRDDPRFEGRRSNVPHGLEEALLRMGDNVFLQVYKQKMPRLRSEGDEIEVEQPEISAEDLVVCREESNNFVLVSLDDALKLVEGVDGVAFLEGDEDGICVEDVYDDDEEEEPDMQIEDNQATPITISPALDPKTIVENAYRVKL